MKRFILGAFIVVGLSFVPQTVFAHVLVMDEAGKQGAIMHIMPDDDPVAGEEAIIYFDRQGADAASDALVTLTIHDDKGAATEVPTETTNALTTAQFTFPKQGVYEIKFTVKESSDELIFTQSQRVTRGVADSGGATQSYMWAESLLVVCSIALLVLGIIFFNRRQEIKNYSKF